MPFKKLMDNLPNGMTDLYEQELRALEPEKREMLMVALRWVICGEGRIYLTLVADELEDKYLQDDDDGDDDPRVVDGWDLDLNTQGNTGNGVEQYPQLGTTPNGANHEQQHAGGTENGPERDCTHHLKTAGRNFLKFDEEDNITLQHTSVRDFISLGLENRSHGNGEMLCQRCKGRLAVVSRGEANPKHGQLMMALRCLKLLNCAAFQHEFLPVQPSVLHQPVFASIVKRSEPRMTLRDSGSDSDDAVSEYDTDSVQEWVDGTARYGPKDAISVCTLTDTWTGRSRSTILGPDGRTDGRDALRYELTHWHYHVKEAERLWPEEERVTEEWLVLYQEIETFLDTTETLQIWQRKVLRSRVLDEFDHAIHIASQYGLLHYIRRYVDAGGDVDVENENGNTPLHLACLHDTGHLAVELLVGHGADVNKRATRGRSDGDTALWYLVQQGGPSALVKYLIDHGADASVADQDGWTILHEAVWAGQFETTKTLLECSSVNIKEISSDKTVLGCAMGTPNVSEKIIKLLVSKGADVNHRGADRCTPLYRAVESNDVVVARFLLESGAKADEAVDLTGRKALHEAIIQGNLDMVNLLLTHGASVFQQDTGFRDAIRLASDAGSVGTLGAVLNAVNNICDVTAACSDLDLSGNTLLHKCVVMGRNDIVHLLLEAGNGRSMLEQQNSDGNTPLQLAVLHGHFDLARLLVEHGADPRITKRARDSVIELATQEWSALNMSNVEFRRQTVAFLLGEVSPMPQLLRRQILSLASVFGSAEVYRRMVERDDQIDWITDAHGWNPLMVMLQNRHAEVVNLLRSFGKVQLVGGASSRPFERGHRPSSWHAPPGRSRRSDNLEVRGTPAISGHGGLMTLERANHPVPFGTSRYYWEMTVVQSTETVLGLGFCDEPSYMIWSSRGTKTAGNLWIYCGIDGTVVGSTGRLANMAPFPLRGPGYRQGDTVGCGVDFVTMAIFFTKNGNLIGKSTFLVWRVPNPPRYQGSMAKSTDTRFRRR